MHFMPIVRSLFGRGGRPRKSLRYRPEVTALEGRWLPSTITEFPLPPLSFGGTYINAITGGPDGNLWFTDPAAGKVGRITPAGQVTEFTPPPGLAGAAITAGHDGNLWFAAGSFSLAITRITPAGQFATFNLGENLGSVGGLTAGPDGNVWFTENVYPFTVEKVGFITPAGQITKFSISVPPGVRGSIGAITTGPDGNLWFTHDGTLATITPTGALEDHVADNVGSALTTGPDGNLWASGARFNPQTGLAGDFIQRISVTGSVTTFSVGTFNPYPSNITTGPDGNLWFTEPYVNQMGRITPAGQMTLFTVPTPNSMPTGIAAGSNGNVFFTEAASRHIGEIVAIGKPPAPAAATATRLAIDVSAPAVGQTVHLTATVTSAAGTPTGAVIFYDSNTFLGTADLNRAGQAVIAGVFHFAIPHNLIAVFNGSPAFAASQSPVLRVTVSQAATTSTLTASANPVAVGHTLVLTVKVQPAFTGAGAPTGAIILKDGNNTIGSATVDASGGAVFRFIAGRSLPRGKHHLTVSYLGDGVFAASVSAALDLTVA
jgi:streptogramin lyase